MNLNEPTSGKAVPTVPGLYRISFLKDGEAIFSWQGSMEDVLEDAKNWRWHIAGKLFYCPECDFFDTTTQGVQRHSEREHDCHYETYEDAGHNVRVRTIRCHQRKTVAEAPATARVRT